jgi:hypothetical protein
MQAYKHIFTLPSSVEKKVKATRSGNACIHGMTWVTTAFLTYVAIQVHLALELYYLKLNIWSALLCPITNISVL